MIKIGSLFSGYGGLDLAAERVTGGKVVWHCEWEDAPSKILEKNFPGVPNYKDVTKIDWSQVEPVDVLVGGFPCQDLSVAGKRAGIKEGTRSGLWINFWEAINELRPRMVIIENVKGILSGKAESRMELGDGSVGYNPNKPTLRALGVVAGSLANIGYDCRWTTLRASDAGAPHRRERVYIVAIRQPIQDTIGN